MLVLIYKRSGSKLLFPAVYSEKEMDEKMLVAKTDELTGAGILKADGDRFLLTEPYISFIDGITQAELFASASVPSGETPPLFAYFCEEKVICIEAVQTRPGQFRICEKDRDGWAELVSARFGIENEAPADADSFIFGGEKIFSDPAMRCESDGEESMKYFNGAELLAAIAGCRKGGISCDIG